MKEFICRVAQKGFFAGPVHAAAAPVSRIEKTPGDPGEETLRLDRAADAVRQAVKETAVPEKNIDVMETVRMMLDDEAFIGEIKQYIRDEKCNAEYAVSMICGRYAEKLRNARTGYLRARASDVSGLGEQLIRVMRQDAAPVLAGPTALAAPDISPAQMTMFDSRLVGGIITDRGSPNSHLSILAGNLEIPYVFGNAEAVAAAAESGFVIIDDGRLITDPDDGLKAEAEERMARAEAEKSRRAECGNGPVCRTRILANITGPEDIPQLLRSGADGVGLFRSEFLFLGKTHAPSEEEQYQAYRSVLEAMGDREVIIRTMDLGSDKTADWLRLPGETNPALGLRGVRISLEKKEIFGTQLRALLRAGTSGNLKIMFPMIASEWEIDEIRACVEKAAAELEKEKRPYRIPDLGIMIETPAAAVIADVLAKKVDFFSIGTNDLTQYTLALDREARGLDRYFDPHHEAVFRLIGTVIRKGHDNNAATGICGQLAADPEAIGRLIADGVDELSVPVSKVRQVREKAAEAEAAQAAAKRKNADGTAAGHPVSAPADGELIPMNEIPDPVFSGGQLGKCIGILPDNGNIYSPCGGTVESIAETLHAVTIRSDEGDEYLIHIGIDTVKLGGKGFRVSVREGERVNRAQKIAEADLDFIRKNGYCAMVVLAKL